MKKSAIAIIVIAVLALAAYFALSIYVLPKSYLSISPPKPEPVFTNIALSALEISLGQFFDLSITATNKRETADLQIVSVEFPNLTRTDDFVTITKYDFSQKPLFIKLGREIGAEYTGGEKSIFKKYPSIEAINRPWNAGDSHGIDLEIKPDKVGRFVIFVKTIALPHLEERAHFPRDGIKDDQNEYVSVYSVEVKP